MENDNSPEPKLLDDELLQNVAGGMIPSHADSDSFNAIRKAPYLCPTCGGMIYFSSWLRYHCVMCEESWYDASALIPNADIEQCK